MHTGDATSTAGSVALTIANNAVTNAKLADMATGTIKGRSTAGTGDPEDLTGTQATALLDAFTSSDKGLVPARAAARPTSCGRTGTWAAPPGGGGTPEDHPARCSTTTPGPAGAADVEIEGGQLRLPMISTPAGPVAGGVKVPRPGAFNGQASSGFPGPDGKVRLFQNDLGEFSVQRFQPAAGLNSLVGENSLNMVATGTATSAGSVITNLHTMKSRLDVLVTTVSTTAIAALRPNGFRCPPGSGGGRERAGRLWRFVWGPATGVSNTSNRAFCGLDEMRTSRRMLRTQPRLLALSAWAGTRLMPTSRCTTTRRGRRRRSIRSGFPVPTTDRSEVHELQLSARTA